MEDVYIGPYAGFYQIGYDLCAPRERRNIAYSVTCTHNESAADIQQQAMKDYGPDHPQAQGEFCCPLKP